MLVSFRSNGYLPYIRIDQPFFFLSGKNEYAARNSSFSPLAGQDEVSVMTNGVNIKWELTRGI
jgi:hypothetical protein